MTPDHAPTTCATCQYASAPICDACDRGTHHHCAYQAYDIHHEQFTACACQQAGHEEN